MRKKIIKYNTVDENLCMWKCHPEKLCINCAGFIVVRPSELRDFRMCCDTGFWKLDCTDSKNEYIDCLMLARNCEEYRLDNCCHADLEGY